MLHRCYTEEDAADHEELLEWDHFPTSHPSQQIQVTAFIVQMLLMLLVHKLQHVKRSGQSNAEVQPANVAVDFKRCLNPFLSVSA